MFLDVYIGDIADPRFSWDDGNWEGNVPRRISPFFPDGHRAYSVLVRRIGQGMYVGKQTDWGGWVAKVSKGEIQQFLLSCLNIDVAAQPRSEHAALVEFVRSLDEDRIYALVGAEL